MSRPFDRFVMLADMRTGSNFLEASLNLMAGVTCHGEAFNPVFVARKDHDSYLGVTLAQRDADPMQLLAAMDQAAGDGLAGFRLFHDHDHRVLDHVLADPRCAKIVLTRNPLESYVSLQIARATGQWKLGDARRRLAAKAQFDGAEFAAHVGAIQDYQLQILRALQCSGQTAFWIDYEDIGDLDVIRGLAAFLGVAPPEALDETVKKQNPEAIEDLIENPGDLAPALAQLDRFNLSRSPNGEPRRGPRVPGYLAAAGAPLLFLPIQGNPVQPLRQWLSRLGETPGLLRDFDRKSLRGWRRANPGARSFTLVRHPVLRAWSGFDARILQNGAPELRQALKRGWKLDLPPPGHGELTDPEALRAGFAVFLKFLRGNLAGQTAQRIDAAWASQAAAIAGFSEVVTPDLILREDRMANGLRYLAAETGTDPGTLPAPATPPLPPGLDRDTEAAVRDAYARDYQMFGFGDLIS